MRIIVFFFVLAVVVASIGLGLMLYVRTGGLDQVKIEFRPAGSDTGDLAPVVLPRGVSRAVLASRGHRILVELGHPGAVADPPAVIFVQGASEASTIPFATYADQLRRAGVATVLVHDTGAPAGDRTDILLDTIDYVKRCRNVDGTRIGLVAFSEAASLALVVAGLEPSARVVTLQGATMPAGMTSELANDLPRSLLITGEKDAGGIASLQAIESLLQSRGKACEVHVQTGVGPGPLSAQARTDAWNRMFRYQLDFVH